MNFIFDMRNKVMKLFVSVLFVNLIVWFAAAAGSNFICGEDQILPSLKPPTGSEFFVAITLYTGFSAPLIYDLISFMSLYFGAEDKYSGNIYYFGEGGGPVVTDIERFSIVYPLLGIGGVTLGVVVAKGLVCG